MQPATGLCNIMLPFALSAPVADPAIEQAL
jgi:hypothetical protein